jgi:hypothetical protein
VKSPRRTAIMRFSALIDSQDGTEHHEE